MNTIFYYFGIVKIKSGRIVITIKPIKRPFPTPIHVKHRCWPAVRTVISHEIPITYPSMSAATTRIPARKYYWSMIGVSFSHNSWTIESPMVCTAITIWDYKCVCWSFNTETYVLKLLAIFKAMPGFTSPVLADSVVDLTSSGCWQDATNGRIAENTQ